VGRINDPSAREGRPIIDAHNSGETIVQVGDANLGAEGEGAMGCCQRARAENFSAGGAIAKEARTIPTGLAHLDALCRCQLLGLHEGNSGRQLE